jgi:hypothetical protein
LSFELEEKYKKEAEDYFQGVFFKNSANGVLDGNAILYSGHYALLYALLFDNYPLADWLSESIYEESKLDWGIITRGPHKWEDNQSHDDYIGLATISFLGKYKWVAWQFKERGPSFHRKGRPLRAWFNSQLWRIPGVWQHLNLFDKIFWSLGIFSTSFAKKESTSGRIMDWHLRSVYRLSKKNYWLCNKAMEFVEKRNAKIYPNLMGDVFSIYFTKDHILAKWSIGIK